MLIKKLGKYYLNLYYKFFFQIYPPPLPIPSSNCSSMASTDEADSVDNIEEKNKNIDKKYASGKKPELYHVFNSRIFLKAKLFYD